MRGCVGNGQWQPTLSFSPDGLQRAYIKFGHWLFCTPHKDSIELADLLDKPLGDGTLAWDSVVMAFVRAGKLPPDRSYTNLIWRLA